MRLLMIGLVLVLGGCAEGGLMGYSREVTGGGRGLPATRMAQNDTLIVPAGRGDVGFAVRSFTAGPDGDLGEVAGVTCEFAGGGLAARVVTPARLVLPDLGFDAPTLSATCASATSRGAAVVPPVFAWANGGGNPVQRAVWGGGGAPGGAEAGPLRYPNVDVVLQ